MSWLGDAAQVATAAGVVFAAAALAGQLRQRKEALAQLYVERFWTILDQRSADESYLVDAQAYRRLCEDEFEIVRLGWIDAGTWEVWHSAMATEFGNAQVGQLTGLTFSSLCADQWIRVGAHAAYACDAMKGVPRARRLRQRVGGRSARRALAAAAALRQSGM